MIPDPQLDSAIVNNLPPSRTPTLVLHPENEPLLFPLTIVHPSCAGTTTIHVRSENAIHIVYCDVCSEQMSVHITCQYQDGQDGDISITYQQSQPVINEPPIRASRVVAARPIKRKHRRNSN